MEDEMGTATRTETGHWAEMLRLAGSCAPNGVIRLLTIRRPPNGHQSPLPLF